MYSDVRTITEITIDYSNAGTATARINAYLNMGWSLLDIHRRGYDHTQEGEGSRFSTVYILGHAEPHAVHPQRRETEISHAI